MINENLSKIGELGIWLIQWFGDFFKDIKVLQIRTLNSIIRFLVAPQKEELLFQVTLFLCLLWKFVAFKIRPWLLIYLQKL